MTKILFIILSGIWEEMPSSTYTYDNSISKSSNVHEATHFINAKYSKFKSPPLYGNYHLYCLGNFYIVENPKFSKKEVSSYIPEDLRLSKYDIYVNSNRYENYPLYVFDELTAYTNGAATTLENKDNSNSISDFSSILEMSVYCVGVMEAIKDKDIDLYFREYENLSTLLIKAEKVYSLGINQYPHNIEYKNQVKNHPFYAKLEKIIGKGCFQ